MAIVCRRTLKMAGPSLRGAYTHGLAQRAQIILLLADGVRPGVVMQRVGVSSPTIYKWRARFKELGLEGLSDLPRSGPPRKLTEQKIKQVLTLTTQRVPKEATHRSLRLMARYAGTTVWQVHQIWMAAGLKPHRLQSFKISNDPMFAEKVVDVVGLYLNPPDNAMVLAVDERTQIQARDGTQAPCQCNPVTWNDRPTIIGATGSPISMPPSTS